MDAYVSSRSFVDLALMFRSLMHFELIFIQSVRQGSNFIHLYVDSQLSQHRFLKRLSFLLNSLVTLAKNQLAVNVSIYICTLYSTPLVNMSVIMPGPDCSDYCSFLVHFESRKCGSNFALLFQGLVIWDSQHFHMNFRISLSIYAKKPARILRGIRLNLQTNLDSIVKTQDKGCLSNYLSLLQFLSMLFCSFQGISPIFLSLNLFLFCILSDTTINLIIS